VVEFHFLDRIVECEPGIRVVALKALAYNEEFFADHFPGMPVAPGAMILEGLVQAGRHCVSAVGDTGNWALWRVKGMRFNRFATPGDVLRLEAERDKEEDGAIWFKGKVEADGEPVGRMRFALRPVTGLPDGPRP